MTYADLVGTVEGFLQQQWTTLGNGIDIAWPIGYTPSPAKAFIRPTLKFISDARITLGPSGTWRTTGVLTVQCFSPKNEPRGAMLLAGTVADIFRDATVESMVFRDFTPAEIGWNGEHWQHNLSAAFFSDRDLGAS